MYKNKIYNTNIEIDEKLLTVNIFWIYLVASDYIKFKELITKLKSLEYKESEILELCDVPF